jgi:hypothetical protein
MKMRATDRFRLSAVLLLLLFVGFVCPSLRAEDQGSAGDSTSTAPDTVDLVKKAMEDFHEVLRPLWHESFAEGDLETIREKAPVLTQKLMTLLKVKPPAKLGKDEEKLRNFMAKRQELAFQVTQVDQAAKEGPDSTLSSAFEAMHWAYEELEKVFAEPIKELDSFHETLYFLWHKALPERDYQAIRKTAPVLKAEIDSLVKASLPEGCKVKQEEFDKKRTALKDAVYQFAERCEKGSQDEIDASLVAVHDKFVALNLLLR